MKAFSDGENTLLHVVTVAVGEERDGCVVSFATQCSIYPPRFLVCLSVVNHTFSLAQRADGLAIHRLGSDQHELARRFGGTTGDRTDKFSEVAFHTGASGAPILEDCASYLDGWIAARVPFGDHWGMVIEPLGSGVGGHSGELHLSDVDFDAGHPPEESLAAP